MRCGYAFSAWIKIVNAVGRGVEKSNGQDSQRARVSEGPGAENERRGGAWLLKAAAMPQGRWTSPERERRVRGCG